MRKRIWTTVALAAMLAAVAGVATAAGQLPFPNGSTVDVGSIDTTMGTNGAAPANDTPGESEDDPASRVNGAIKQFHGKPVSTPTPTGMSVVNGGGANGGFSGLTHADQRLADGGNQFSLEPPDQALCVGGGYVVEGVNLAFRVFDPNGNPLTGPVAYNPFFTNDHAINRNVEPLGVRGWFISDPKCYYDSDTGRFFMTVLGINPDNFHSAQFIAVTKTGDPTGEWYKYAFDTTDNGENGTPNDPTCADVGCFGDQPLIGADKYGFYVTTNEFGGTFNGAQVYAMSKTALENGQLGTVVHLQPGNLQEGQAYSIQPATAPNGQYDLSNGGTEYFLSALEFTGGLDNRIAAWTMTNTSSLSSASPNVKLQYAVMKSEAYGAPPPVTQKDGPRPLGESIPAPAGKLNSNDDRMNQVVYAGGLVWGGVNTIVQTQDGSTQTGIAWFAADVHAKGGNGKPDGHIKQQGYVSVNGNSVMFPAIGATASGKAVMAFTLAGPDYFPSAAWTTLTGGDGTIHVSGAGQLPADGFTAYVALDPGDNGVERWGDYGAAVPGPNGSIWLASEYIPDAPRTVNANWGTFITSVTP
jgi:hypothetical protein